MGLVSEKHKKRHKYPMGKPLRLLTWNIRYDWMGTPISGQKVPRHTLHKDIDISKETPWLKRGSKLIAGLELQAATHGIIALQEVLHGQLVDIERGLNAHSPGKWKYIGVGRDDGVTRGEYSPIFYNTEVHELISWRYFWLSEHPDRPGRGWDAASVRICTVGRFGFKSSDAATHEFTMLVFIPFRPRLMQTTHFDDQGRIAREKGAALIVEAVDFELKSSSCPVFLLGDLNSPVEDAAYRTIAARMHDLRDYCTETYGHYNTFTGFEGRKNDLSRIDHIFGSVTNGWKAGVFCVEENHFEDEIWLSDHRLVMADVSIGKDLKAVKRLK